MINFMYIFEILPVEFIKKISVSKKHTLARNEKRKKIFFCKNCLSLGSKKTEKRSSQAL